LASNFNGYSACSSAGARHTRAEREERLLGKVIQPIRLQVDACRLGGLNEVLAVQLRAAKFGNPVCHAGGVGLCEYV
jgi:L-alanine-DL-glutamate epimerase-like enolase superfamily enzyme